MKLTLHIWRQKNADEKGGFATYELEDVDTHMSFLEMLDVLNQDLIANSQEPVAFEHDCREGICGACGFVINGVAHGHQHAAMVLFHAVDVDDQIERPKRSDLADHRQRIP